MKKINLIYMVLLVVLFSCTKLDEEVYDKIPEDLYPENAQQIGNLSADAYTQLKYICDDEGWWFLAQEISSDELCGPTRGSDWYDGGKWLNVHQHTWTNDDESVNRMWDKFWSGVTICNDILDMMRALPTSDALSAKMCEVEVIRSFYYYLLIDNYGDVPYLTTSGENAPEKPFKAKREDVFDSLVTTIKHALPSLKNQDIKYMANRYMGFALLTKLYLNAEVYTGTAMWEDALVYCDSVLAGPYTMEPTDFMAPFVTNNEKNQEIIFSIPFDEDNYQGFRLHMRTLHYQHNLKYDMPVGPWNGFCVVPTFFDTYDDSDLRKTKYHIFGMQYDSKGNEIIDGLTGLPLNIDPHVPALYMQSPDFTPEQIRTTGARVGKYEIKMGAKENLSNDFPLFRITDFNLIKAELMIRLNGPGAGDEWIMPVRERAGVASLPPTSGWTLDDLLAERGRELYVEGHRRQDLIRYGKWEQEWWEKAAHGPELRVFPIPKWATDANPNLLLDPQ